MCKVRMWSNHTPSKLFLLVMGLSSALSYALPEDRDQRINIAADQASFNQKTGLATYKGNIVITQGSVKIRADELILTTDGKGNVKTAVAKGKPAHFEQQPNPDKGIATAEATEVSYNAQDGIIVLKGQAKLQQDGSNFQGVSISYNLDRGEIEAAGDQQTRVQLSFPPPSKENRQSKRLGETPP